MDVEYGQVLINPRPCPSRVWEACACAVEQITMYDEQLSTIKGFVNERVVDMNVAVLSAEHSPHERIMIAGCVEHSNVVHRLIENGAHDVCTPLSPFRLFGPDPAVDDVTDEIEVLALEISQEFIDVVCPASRRTEVEV